MESIKFEDGEETLRLGYYIIGKKPKMKNRWVWGQSAPFIPKKDLLKLVKKAKNKGML